MIHGGAGCILSYTSQLVLRVFEMERDSQRSIHGVTLTRDEMAINFLPSHLATRRGSIPRAKSWLPTTYASVKVFMAAR